MVLLRCDEQQLVAEVRAGAPPRQPGPRMANEMVAATAEGMVPRTVTIDAAATAHAAPTRPALSRTGRVAVGVRPMRARSGAASP